MAPVTIASGDKNAYYSAGNLGWSARSVVAYYDHELIQLSGAGSASFGSATTNARHGQSFTTSGAISVSGIRVPIRKNGSPADNLTIDIQTDSATKPSGSVLDTSDVFSGASLTTSLNWIEFTFATPVALSAATKYWFTIKRSGAVDASNYYSISVDTGNPYASHGQSIYNSGTGLWGSESAFNDLTFQIIEEAAPLALYAVTQDTSLHVWKSTDDGASWSEQDSGDAPSVTNADYPFDAPVAKYTPHIITARMTATNTAAVRVFDMSTDQWDAADYGITPPSTVSNERNIRISSERLYVASSPGELTITYTDSGDDADIVYQRISGPGNSWSGKSTTAAVTSAEASLLSEAVTDKAIPGFTHRFYYQCTDDDFVNRSITGGSTQGTATALSTAAADVETEHASATYQPYDASGVTTIIAAFIDAGGTIQERILSLDVTSASVSMASDTAVSTATTTAGRQLSTCRYDGTNYIFAAVSGTGISYYESTTPGSWSSATVLLSGGTNIVLSQAIAIEGLGLGIAYTNNGNVMFEWGVDGPSGGSEEKDVTDSALVTASDSAALVAQIAASDSVAISVTDSPAVTIPVQASDTATLAITDSAAIAVAISGSDNFTVTASDTAATAASIAATDATTITTADAAITAATIAATDAVTIAPGIDFGLIETTEPKSSTDSIVITITDQASITVEVAASDTTTIVTSESAATATAITIADAITLTATETAATTATVTATDSAVIAPTDQAIVAAAMGASDTAEITLTEQATYSTPMAVTDAASIELAETASTVAYITASDGVIIQAVDAVQPMQATVQAADSATIAADDLAGIVAWLATSDAILIDAVDTVIQVGDPAPVPPTVFGQPLSATLTMQRVLDGSLRSERPLTATLTMQRVLAAELEFIP